MAQRRLPSFRGIEAFLALAETGSVRAAARSLNLTVSAVSHRLRVLEGETGVPLFIRGGQKVILTPAAQRFHEDLGPISQALMEATARLAQLSEQPKLKVAATNVIISYWLTNHLARWRSEFPGVTLDINAIDPDQSDDSADIVIRSLFHEEPRPDEILLFRWTITPVCRPELVERFDLREPAALHGVPLIDVRWPLGGWDSWLRLAKLDTSIVRPDLVLDSHDLMMDAASRALGITIGAVAMAEEYLNRGLVMPFGLTCDLPGGCYINGPDPNEASVAGLFRDWLLEATHIDRARA